MNVLFEISNSLGHRTAGIYLWGLCVNNAVSQLISYRSEGPNSTFGEVLSSRMCVLILFNGKGQMVVQL